MKKIIEIREDIKIGNVILEKGDKIIIYESSPSNFPFDNYSFETSSTDKMNNLISKFNYNDWKKLGFSIDGSDIDIFKISKGRDDFYYSLFIDKKSIIKQKSIDNVILELKKRFPGNDFDTVVRSF